MTCTIVAIAYIFPFFSSESERSGPGLVVREAEPQDAPLAVRVGAQAGGRVHGADGVAGAHQEVRQPLGRAGRCVALSLPDVMAVRER